MGKMLRIYRVDLRSDGSKGPFIYASRCLDDASNELDCKDPNDLTIIPPNGYDPDLHRFGFIKKQQLLNTFDEIMRTWLKEQDFVLSRYLVAEEKAILDRHQCVFEYVGAKREILDLI